MKNIIVAGGAGYIGSHACKSLFETGKYIPITIDNLINGNKDSVKWGPLEIGDICDRDFLVAVFKKYKPDAIMLFAAYAYVGESIEYPQKYYNNNLQGTLSILDAMKECGIKKIIFSSSCATYGLPETDTIDEKHTQLPVNPYGWSKLMCEQIIKDYCYAYGFKAVSLRYFNAAGADKDAEIGELHDPETHLIPIILEVASGKREYIEIYGDDYNTPDGTCIRDYIHVFDLANAHTLALQYVNNIKNFVAFNLGLEKGYSIKEVIEVSELVTKKNISVKHGGRREGDPEKLVANGNKARETLNWQPIYSDLSQIISTAWSWEIKEGKFS